MKSLDDLGIVVIDMQEFFAGGSDRLINKQNELFDSFRNSGAKTYLMEFDTYGDTLNKVAFNADRGYVAKTYIKKKNSCFEGVILDKSNGESIDFNKSLEKDGVERLIFTGAYGDMCVYDSLSDAVGLGYDCFSSEDLNKNLGLGFCEKDYDRLGVNYFDDLDGLVKMVKSSLWLVNEEGKGKSSRG